MKYTWRQQLALRKSATFQPAGLKRLTVNRIISMQGLGIVL
jgi:hypothetical protein